MKYYNQTILFSGSLFVWKFSLFYCFYSQSCQKQGTKCQMYKLYCWRYNPQKQLVYESYLVSNSLPVGLYWHLNYCFHGNSSFYVNISSSLSLGLHIFRKFSRLKDHVTHDICIYCKQCMNKIVTIRFFSKTMNFLMTWRVKIVAKCIMEFVAMKTVIIVS